MMEARKWYKFVGDKKLIDLGPREKFILKGNYYVFDADDTDIIMDKKNNGYTANRICLLEREQNLFRQVEPTWKDKLQLKGEQQFNYSYHDEDDGDEDDEWQDDEE